VNSFTDIGIFTYLREKKMNDSKSYQIFMRHLLKAHQHIESALCEFKNLSTADKSQYRNMNFHASLIDMELLQLLNGHNDLDLIFDEEE